MAPADPTDTGRFWLDYSDGLHDHSMQVRYNDGVATVADIMSGIDALLLEMAPVMYEITVLGARFAGQGSHVSVPVAWTGATTYGDDGAAPLLNGPVQLRFEGRSVTGKRGSVTLWAYSGGVPGTFRTTITVGSPLAGGLEVIQAGQAGGYFVSIDNFAMNMKTYVNLQWNSYWERKQRP